MVGRMATDTKTVRIYGDPVLREKARPVEKVDAAVRALAKRMVDTMHAERGVGLAAEQVGETVCMCVIDVPPEYDKDEKGERHNPGVAMPLVLINPEITELSKETRTGDEGCLSFPGIYVPVVRSAKIAVKFLDLQGKPQSLELREFVARAVQHEVDHLNGVLLIDRMSRLKRIALAGQLKRMKQETQEQLGL